MNYIVLDLEWNQSTEGKENSIKEMPFEIFEIGAVKLDENRQYVDSFSRYIKLQVYKQLHYIARELTHVTQSKLDEGGYFSDVAEAFLEWCGEDYMMCTWGALDLTELQRNMRYYNVPSPFPMPFKFYDLQKLYSIEYDDGDIRKSLETAVNERNIPKKQEFHSAISDAQYTAKVFAAMDFEKVSGYYSIDTYYIPQNRKQEIYVNFGTYSKYISRGFYTKEEAFSDKKVLMTTCYLCGKQAKKRIRWFTANSKIHYCLSECKEHGYIKGRFRVKEDDFGKFFVTKILKITDEAGAQEIKSRQLDMRKKRYDRRHRK